MSWLAVDLSSATAVTGSGILETVFPDLWVSEVKSKRDPSGIQPGLHTSILGVGTCLM